MHTVHRPFRFVIIACLLVVLWFSMRAVNAAPSQADQPGADGPWRAKMNEIATLVRDLGPYMTSEKAFSDPANRKQIQEMTGKLSKAASQIDLSKHTAHGALKAPDQDPALPFISSQFDESMKRAHQSFKEGHAEYSRSLLRTAVSYCVSCHTRTETTANIPKSGFNDAFSDLDGAERIRFFAATRQFDKVTEEFETTFAVGKEARVVDLESAARVALSVAVRVKRDLDEAGRIAARVIAHPSAPSSLKDDARVWAKEIQLWKSEASKTPTSPEAMLAAARELVIKGQILQESPADSRGDISYLKASALLHDLLKTETRPELTADALYFIGVCYEALRDLGFWTLHENYYEACIGKQPNTARSEACFQRLNDSITAGYTGTRGTDVPSEIRRHLNQLKKLAKASK